VVTNASNSNNGTIYCQLAPWDERSKSTEQVPGIIGELQKRIRDSAGIKNAAVEVIQPSPLPGVGTTVGFSMQIEQRSTTIICSILKVVMINLLLMRTRIQL
jgi:multidrug efflux pump subunit AcrB